MYTALALIKEEIKNAHDMLESVVVDIKPEDIQKDPGGKAFPLGSLYAHLVFSEDAIVNGMIRKSVPLFAGEWAAKTGASSPMPAMDANWAANNETWSKSVTIDLTLLQTYAKAVYANTDAYIATLTDDDMEKEIDMGDWGKKKLGLLLAGFVVGHTYSLAGEISAIKGVHGSKGYPF